MLFRSRQYDHHITDRISRIWTADCGRCTRTQRNTNISLEQLRSAVKGRHPSPVLGLYVGTLQYGVEIDDTIWNVAPDRICATPRYAILTIRLNSAIYIPREFLGNSCLEALARAHEAKHADADVQALDRFRPLVAPAVREALRHDTAMSSNTAEEAVPKLTKGLVAAVDHVFGEMTVARQHLDAEIDSPAELERLSRACDHPCIQ